MDRDEVEVHKLTKKELGQYLATLTSHLVNNASVNSSGAHPPPPGNRGAFAYVVSPGGWALAYPRATPGHLTHVFSKDG